MGLIQSGAFVTSYFASGQILSGAIGDNTLNSGNYSSGSICNYHMNSGMLPGLSSLGGNALGMFSAINQTANVSGLVYQVKATGLYAVKSFVDVLQGGLLNAGTMSVNIIFNSDSQIQTMTPIVGVALITSGAFGQSCNYVRSLSGTNIIANASLGSIVGTPHYNIFVTAERIF